MQTRMIIFSDLDYLLDLRAHSLEDHVVADILLWDGCLWDIRVISEIQDFMNKIQAGKIMIFFYLRVWIVLAFALKA